MTNPIVLTYTTDIAHSGTARLIKSLKKWGWSYEILRDSRWTGFGKKLKRVVARMHELAATNQYTHAISIDAHDFIATGPSTEFVAPKVPLLLATEVNCWPRIDLKDFYPKHSSPWCFAHSPFTVDLTRLDLLKIEAVQDYTDDQLHVTQLFLEGNKDITLDYECNIVQSIAFCQPFYDKFDKVEGRLINKITGSKPLFVHGNGTTDLTFFEELGN